MGRVEPAWHNVDGQKAATRPYYQKVVPQDIQLANMSNLRTAQIKEPDSAHRFLILVKNFPTTTLKHPRK